ncbi:hypothetical protein V6Z11_D12G301500 [Gossypium hirsutum]
MPGPKPNKTWAKLNPITGPNWPKTAETLATISSATCPTFGSLHTVPRSTLRARHTLVPATTTNCKGWKRSFRGVFLFVILAI